MSARSAGILLFRRRPGGLEVFLVHPGGPFWARKDDGAWSIAKGEIEDGEDALEAARRELTEETGAVAVGHAFPLGELQQNRGKRVIAWAVEGDFDPSSLCSNPFSCEWPPGSGQTRTFPEVDRCAWFGLEEARRKVLPGQVDFIDRLVAAIGA